MREISREAMGKTSLCHIKFAFLNGPIDTMLKLDSKMTSLPNTNI